MSIIGSDQMKIILGIGNPGVNYQYTKHNVGFDVIDCISASS